MEGLARLEYRGYDSAGVALVTADGVTREKRAGKLDNLRSALEADPLAASRTGIGHTRWATHGGPTDRNAHPHRGGDGGPAGPHPQRHHRELPRAEDASCSRRASSSAPRPTPRSPRSSSAASTTGSATSAEAMRNVVQRLEGAFTLLAVHADSPGVVVGARRNSPLVVGLGDGENFLGSDVAAFIGHTRHALELGQDQIVTITPDGYTVIDFDGTPVGGQALRGHLGRRRGREGRLRHLHGEGDQRPAARRRRHPAGPHRRRRPARARRGADQRGAAARGRPDHHRRLRHRGLRRHGREVRHRALDPHPGRGRARARVPLLRPDRRRHHPGRRRSASPARRWTP